MYSICGSGHCWAYCAARFGEQLPLAADALLKLIHGNFLPYVQGSKHGHNACFGPEVHKWELLPASCLETLAFGIKTLLWDTLEV